MNSPYEDHQTISGWNAICTVLQQRGDVFYYIDYRRLRLKFSYESVNGMIVKIL